MMPLLGGFTVSVLLAGSAVSLVGFYVPFMLAASIATPIASGLLTTMTADGPLWRLIAFEVLFGVGGGIALQSPQVAVQTTLADADISMGVNIIIFMQNFGAALSISVAQSLFTSQLISNLRTYVPDIETDTEIKALITASELSEALIGYDKAITQTFYICVGLTCLAAVGSVTMGRRSVKGKKS